MSLILGYSESQANGTHNMQSSTSDQQKCEKLFDADKSNNFLYSSNNSSQMDSKSAEDVVTECADSNKTFKCFYCFENYSSDEERVTHIEYEHPGKMYYPTQVLA
jgi:hypothetical protein